MPQRQTAPKTSFQFIPVGTASKNERQDALVDLSHLLSDKV